MKRAIKIWGIVISVVVFLSLCTLGLAYATQYTLTNNLYSETDDLDTAVKNEFGPSASVGDWVDIKANYSGNIVSFCDNVGLLDYLDNAWVYNNGAKWWSGNRHYFIERHNGNVPYNWLVHDNIDNHTLDLGSWYGLRMPILVKIESNCTPSVATYDETTGKLNIPSVLTSSGECYSVDMQKQTGWSFKIINATQK